MRVLAYHLIIVLLFPLICYAQENSPRFLIWKNRRAGYVDATGRIVIPPAFDDARNFKDGLAPVFIGSKWGYIDISGKIVIRPQFFEADQFNEGLAVVGMFYQGKKVIDGKVGYYSYIDRLGKLITDRKFDVAFGFSEGVADVMTSDYKHLYIDKSGKSLFEFDTYEPEFKNGRALFKTNGNMHDTRVGFIDKSGKIAIPATYVGGKSFSEGFACMYDGQRFGYIDTAGRTTIDFKFDDCRSFSEGLAAVNIEGKWGFVDKAGGVVIEPQFLNVGSFSDGAASVFVGENQSRLRKQRHLRKRLALGGLSTDLESL